jgi:hypothetical protein
MGSPGIPGAIGEVGIKGSQGMKGSQGQRGPAGPPVSNHCYNNNKFLSYSRQDDDDVRFVVDQHA